MGGRILVMNAGSTSLKFALFDAGLKRFLWGELSGVGTDPVLEAQNAKGAVPVRGWNADGASHAHDLIAALMRWLEAHIGPEGLLAVGHRIVTGGLERTEPCVIDATELARLKASVPLSPLHLPRNLEPVEALMKVQPDLPQVACFDTAFHATLPPEAATYALPRELTQAGARRYGFHGLSYDYIAGRLAELDPRVASGRVIVAHLGGGASLCAMREGKSVATTMGFSPLSGLVMATRPGELDAGVVLWLMRRGLSADEIEALLYREAGLKGVSGTTGDMKALLSANAPEAREAVALYLHRLVQEMGGLVAVLGGLDALVFTAGVGEHAAPIRSAVCKSFCWLGLDCRETDARGERRISTRSSRVSVWVIPTDEEVVVARNTARLVEEGVPA